MMNRLSKYAAVFLLTLAFIFNGAVFSYATDAAANDDEDYLIPGQYREMYRDLQQQVIDLRDKVNTTPTTQNQEPLIKVLSPQTISDGYTVLPSASSVLVARVKDGNIAVTLNGTGTKAAPVGASANKNDLLVLVKFRAGGFFHFCGFNQHELTDGTEDFQAMDKTFFAEIETSVIKADGVEGLAATLDGIFLRRLANPARDTVSHAVSTVIARSGNVTVRELSAEFFYSEKQIRRLFLRRVGATPKTFARIVRFNRTLALLREGRTADAAARAGYFDQSHLIHEFKELCGLAPGEYLKNLSDFYNAESI